VKAAQLNYDDVVSTEVHIDVATVHFKPSGISPTTNCLTTPDHRSIPEHLDLRWVEQPNAAEHQC